MPLSTQAGELVIRNASASAIVCHADGYTAATGWPSTWDITVHPGSSFSLAPSYNRSPVILDWAECGGLKTRGMGITPQGNDGLVLFTGKQKRVLNIALYPDIPSHPNGNFRYLLDHVVSAYQAIDPNVLLNAVMADEDKIYSFDGLPTILGSTGYDVVELDTLYLGFLASSNLITPAKITGDEPLPVAKAASTYHGVLYGVPSWLCMDFIFSYSSALKSVHTLSELVSFLASKSKTELALLADYDGSWRIPSIYINAYVQAFGYQNIAKALTMPPEPSVIANLKALAGTCDFASTNSCINGTNHAEPDGTIERVFASGNATSDMGFSEQSFYILLNRPNGSVTIVPATWGEKPQPLLYSDTFVTNKSTCSSAACQDDSAAFTALMTGIKMKNYIAFSRDLLANEPPRHLLVATQRFWAQPKVRHDPIYAQVATIVRDGQPFPNDFTQQKQSEMDTALCATLKADVPGYKCK